MNAVTTETVLDAIRHYSGEIKDAEGVSVFTTTDIAGVMGCDEYPVRAAFAWLCKNQMIERVEGTACMRRTRRSNEPYSAAFYRVRTRSQVDFDALFRVFGLAGVRQ